MSRSKQCQEHEVLPNVKMGQYWTVTTPGCKNTCVSDPQLFSTNAQLSPIYLQRLATVNCFLMIRSNYWCGTIIPHFDHFFFMLRRAIKGEQYRQGKHPIK